MTVRASSQSSLGRILVVDDDRRMASGLAQWLCGLGWHASAAGSPAEALQSLGRTAWDACILDGGLPGDGGQRRDTSAHSDAIDMDGAGAADAHTTAKFGASEVQ